MRSQLLVGTVRHQRVRPVAYGFAHSVFYLAIDLEELPEVARRCALLSYNRANLCSLRDADHFEGGSIRDAARAHLGLSAGSAARVTMVTYPRVAGYVFNPVTFYLAREGGELTSLLAEVHNTHQERYVYRLENENPAGTPWRSSAAKRFYVSPFLESAGSYAFSVRETPERLDIRITESEGGRPMLFTQLELSKRPLDNRTLASALLRTPLVPLKTTALIHLHALALWRRRVPFHPHGARVRGQRR